MKEDGELFRSAVLIIETDGKFEVRASDPRGFRTNGELILEPDGTLTYTYGEMRGQGRVAQGKGVVRITVDSPVVGDVGARASISGTIRSLPLSEPEARTTWRTRT